MLLIARLSRNLLLASFVSSLSLSAAATILTPSQVTLLNVAKMTGALISHPETIQAILLVESSAGIGGRIGDDGRSLGVMQMKPATAMYVTAKYKWLPKLKDEAAYAARLLTDDAYAILLGTLYFKECIKRHVLWSKAVVCYNVGLAGNVNATKYLTKIRKQIEVLRNHEREASKASAKAHASPISRTASSRIQAG